MGADMSHEEARGATARGSLPRSTLTPTPRAAGGKARPKGPAVGIDLGTTYSCVAVCQRGQVEVIANGHSNRTTPSCVAFTDRERLVGEPAEMQASLNPENTVSCVKRLLGRSYEDPLVQAERKRCPFRVVQDSSGRAKVQVSYKGLESVFHPEEISAVLLFRLKQLAEAHLGCPVTRAVIAVPAHFGDAQRQATLDAGAIAGLGVLALINEPTAAAVAYGLNGSGGGSWRAERHILVFDLGGGTLDVSVLVARDGIFEVVATSGDPHLGGVDFDRRLADHLAQEFKRKHQADLTQSRRATARLRAACEQAKRALSTSLAATVSIDSLYQGVDFHTVVTRAVFEDLCGDLFQATLLHVEKGLADAGLQKTQLHDIVLVGGSTRIPMLQKLLSQFFDGQELRRAINPEEAVAYGAAIQAATLTGHRYQHLQNLLLLDVTPVSLGVETVGGVMDVVVKRNSPVPTKETRNFSTTEDSQSSLFLQVYEGERTLTKHNRLLGSVTLSGLRPAPRCVPIIVVTFHIDHNNILTVSAMERSSGNHNQLTITDTRGRLDREEMERILREEEEHRAHERAEEEKQAALNSLESSALQLKRVATAGKSLDDRAKRRVLEMCEETAAWMEGNRLAPKKEYEARRRELEDTCWSIMAHFGTDGEKP